MNKETMLTKENMQAYCAAWKAGVMESHFVCFDETHLNRLINAGEAVIIHGVPVKLSTMKPIWLYTPSE